LGQREIPLSRCRGSTAAQNDIPEKGLVYFVSKKMLIPMAVEGLLKTSYGFPKRTGGGSALSKNSDSHPTVVWRKRAMKKKSVQEEEET